ncbi:MAG: polysaccharide pyruvyl transferase family protein [Candidatus Omnitrophica bacterium]|nr:polysaccharide pyruvyl transferase family protein [Candidatus Omnitrophota bacterium]
MNKGTIKPVKSKIMRYCKSYVPFWRKGKIGFYSNFGHGDIGDDAAFFVAQKHFGKDVLPFSKRCYAFNPHMLRALLIGGGGALRWESPYIPRRIFAKKKWPFPVIIFGVGINCDFGKSYTEETKDKIKRLCERADYITVRDTITAHFLKELGYHDVQIMPDIDLLLDEEEVSVPQLARKSTIGIVLSPHSAFSGNDFERIVDSFSDFITQTITHDTNIIFFPFENAASEESKEQELIDAIVRKVNDKERVTILKHATTPQQTLFAMRHCCNSMICMRMHAAVFAANAGIPFVCISYNMMHTGFLDMFDAHDCEIRFFDAFSSGKLQEKYAYLISNYDKIRRTIINKRDSLREVLYRQCNHINALINQ